MIQNRLPQKMFFEEFDMLVVSGRNLSTIQRKKKKNAYHMTK